MYTNSILKTAIDEGNIALIHSISMEKRKNGCATNVALSAQSYLYDRAGGSWGTGFTRTPYAGRKIHRTRLSDEGPWN